MLTRAEAASRRFTRSGYRRATRISPTTPADVGVGPYPGPWPDDARLDPELLEQGDRRNVVDRYRYWRLEAIVADLDTRRHAFHVAIENFSTTSTSARSSARPTRSSRARCTSSAAAAGTVEARW